MPPLFDNVVTAITVMNLSELTYEGVKAKLHNYSINQRQVVPFRVHPLFLNQVEPSCCPSNKRKPTAVKYIEK